MGTEKVFDEKAKLRLLMVVMAIAAIVLLAVMCSATSDGVPSEYSMRRIVERNLKDPDSARFSNERVVPMGEGYALCGTVNAKNSFGGYTGPTRFIAGETKAGGDFLYMENDVQFGSLFAGVWAEACKK